MTTADRVAELVHGRFARLPRKGKPTLPDEWTVLAGIVAESVSAGTMRVLVVATGLKCLGAQQYSDQGDAVHDAHAEVLARRAMVAVLLDEVARCERGDVSDLLELAPDPDRPRYRLHSEVKLHLYISQTPCGDASIFPAKVPPATSEPPAKKPRLEKEEPSPGAIMVESSRAIVAAGEDDDDDDFDLQRTGAKCVPDGPQDPLEAGTRFHVSGALRIKPGRGYPTQSLSCSDKLARWAILGLQGALLARWTGPIYLDSVVVGSLFDEDALRRALDTRLRGPWADRLPLPYILSPPRILHTSLRAPCDRLVLRAARTSTTPLRTADAAITWAHHWPDSQAIVKGRMQGASSSKKSRKAHTVRVCRAALAAQAAALDPGPTVPLTYDALKARAVVYQQAKRLAIDHGPLRGWLEQPLALRQFPSL